MLVVHQASVAFSSSLWFPISLCGSDSQMVFVCKYKSGYAKHMTSHFFFARILCTHHCFSTGGKTRLCITVTGKEMIYDYCQFGVTLHLD